MASSAQAGAQVVCTRSEVGWRVQLKLEETAVSWCSVVDRTMRVGCGRLLVGGIGGVGTLPEQRRRGHARRVLEAALGLMADEAYDISFLHGIQDFYGKFGYATCMPEYELWVNTRDAERAVSTAPTRRLRPGDLPRIVELYDRDNALRVGSAVRQLERWRGFRVGTWWSFRALVQVVLDAAGQVAGYVSVDDTEEACRVSEVGGQGETVYAAILGFLARRAVRLRRERIGLFLPEDHPFAVWARQYGLRSQTLFPRAEKGMGRIIDQQRCMQHLCPALTGRWPAGLRSTQLALRTPLGSGRLRWARGKAVWEDGRHAGAVRLEQETLTQLIFGYVRPADLAAWGRLKLPAPQQELFDALFPMQLPQLWWADRF
jgi:predicted acetyltransferase